MLPEPILQILLYGELMGLFHLVLVLAGLILALPCVFISKTKYVIFVRGFVVFNVLLWICGMGANLLWDTFVFEALYTSTDYIFDFVPFFPVTQGYIDRPWGDQTGSIYYGLNILHIQAVWFVFAFATWMATIFLYSRLQRTWRVKDIESPRRI